MFTNNFGSSMKNMERPIASPPSPFPKHIVHSITRGEKGITFSMEASETSPSNSKSPMGSSDSPGINYDNNTIAKKAELNVLKAILNREEYLNRLQRVVRTVSKKFKSEIADLIDIIRVASVNVIEMIVKWRETKDDHDAAFMWNGVNYLLKMPSDFDYLSDVLVIKRYYGFELFRNPFIVTLPLEQGAQQLTELLINPKHIDPHSAASGYIIGGITQKKLKKTYEIQSNSEKISPYSSVDFKAKKDKSAKQTSNYQISANSFVSNEEMSKIRQAERIILKEESKFGIYSRDPDGKIVRKLQALTRHAAIELKKDDHRPMDETAHTVHFAPHAERAGVGYRETITNPDDNNDQQHTTQALDEKKYSNAFMDPDPNLSAHTRGQAKKGGILQPVTTLGAESRPRKPLRINFPSELEFKRYRKIKSLGEKLEELSKLKDEIESEKMKLMQMNGTDSSEKSHSTLKLLRSVASNQLYETRNPSASVLLSSSMSILPPPSHEKSISTSDMIVTTTAKLSIKSGKNVVFQEPSQESLVEISPSSDPNLNLLSNALSQIYNQEKSLNKSEELLKDKQKHLKKERDAIEQLKFQERTSTTQTLAKELERKRRLLTEEEARTRGSASEEPPNVYDHYAIKIQATIRGWLAKCWVKWYIISSFQASVKLQSLVRGWLGRIRVRRINRTNWAATVIQKNFRGWWVRGTSADMAKTKNLMKAAITIQRTWRGLLGRRRARSKRALDAAAKAAFECVDASAIDVGDVKDLGRRILFAIEEPYSTTFPPDEVLHLIRLCIMILQSPRGNLGLVEYNFFQMRSYDEIDGEHLTWLQAAKMMNRAERFIRLIRVIAFGPGAKPPRLVQLSGAANLIYTAQSKNPLWRLDTFENMGLGSKICCQLFKWISSIVEVALRQQEFLSLIASSFPDWLPRLYELQANARHAEFEIELERRCFEKLEAWKELLLEDLVKHVASGSVDKDENNPNIEDGLLPKSNLENSTDMVEEGSQSRIMINMLEHEMTVIRRHINDAKAKLRLAYQEADKVKVDQASREVLALETMTEKVAATNIELEELLITFKTNATNAANGDRAAQDTLPELRLKITNQKLKSAEMASQKKLLELTVEANRVRRKDSGRLLEDIAAKTLIAGDAKFAFIEAMIKTNSMLRYSGVKHASDLPSHLSDIHADLADNEERLRAAARLCFVEADKARKLYDDEVNRELAENEVKEQKQKDILTPPDEELEEERLEDEREAIYERLKKNQYLPDDVMLDIKKRPRQVVVALGRDLSYHAKNKILQELTAYLPGVFIRLDIQDRLGFDVSSMQRVLDTGKSIITEVDYGLTRLTRETFLRNLENIMKALLPAPYFVLAVGDERNKTSSLGTYFGVSKLDLNILRDGDIKAALEVMNWIPDELSTNQSLRKKMQDHSQSLFAPSNSWELVLEALYILLSEKLEIENSIALLDKSRKPTSWRVTRVQLMLPEQLASQMKFLVNKRGGCTLKKLQCIHFYMMHPDWPTPFGVHRNEDLVLDCFSNFVEKWYLSEKYTHDRGGAPLRAITKSIMKGIHTVVVVTDSEDPEDNYQMRESGGWRMSLYRLVRASLCDMVVLKTAMKLNDQMMTVSVYREESMIYFEAYDNESSDVFFTSLTIYDIPRLLKPNGFLSTVSDQSEVIIPPLTSRGMYDELIKLLQLEKVSKGINSRKRLICHRSLTFLQNSTKKINGHRVLIKSYEAGLGELFFTVYIPEYCSQLKLLINEDIRLQLLKNADSSKGCDEGKLSEERDARPLLPYLLDRLRITPSIPMFFALNHRMNLDLSHIIQTKQISTFNKYRAPMSSLYPGAKQLAGVFQLRVRLHGGSGRIQIRKIIEIHHIQYVLEVRTLSATKRLDIRCYEPNTCQTLQCSISSHLRRVLLKYVNDDLHSWLHLLISRIRINLHGRPPQLYLDRTLIKRIFTIAGRKLIISLVALDGDAMEIEIFDSLICELFRCVVDFKSFCQLLNYVSPMEQLKLDLDKGATQLHHSSLPELVQQLADTISLSHKESKSIDKDEDGSSIASHSLTLDDYLVDKNNLHRVMNNVKGLLKMIDKQNYFSGYEIQLVSYQLHLQFLPVNTVKENKLNTSVRYQQRLKTMVSDGTTQGVIAARRQMVSIQMENELNELMFFKSKEANVRVEQDKHAADVLTSHLEGLIKTEADSMIAMVSSTVTTEIVDNIQEKIIERFKERNQPGYHQMKLEEALVSEPRDDQALLVNNDLDVQSIQVDVASIVSNRVEEEKLERLIFEDGMKVNYRDGRVRWHGHVSIKVVAISKWMGEDGKGNKFKFHVYEPNVSNYFLGEIRSTKHLREVLGVHGQDLLHSNKIKEMIMFICKNKLEVVVNNFTWDGVPVTDKEAPQYRIEFLSNRFYSKDKITPINTSEDKKEDENEQKLVDIENARGKKIVRVVRRVSGLLLQLVVFEIPQAIVEAEYGVFDFSAYEKIQNKAEEEWFASLSPEMLSKHLKSQNNKMPENNAFSSSRLSTPAHLSPEEEEEEEEEVVKVIKKNQPTNEKYPPPGFRIVGYEPKSKKKTNIQINPKATVEVAGGIYSPYLHPDKRRELARVVCDALNLTFPGGPIPFELVIPWSGNQKQVSTASVSNGEAVSIRPGVERIKKRDGKLFQSALRISKYELLVTVFTNYNPNQMQSRSSSPMNKQKPKVNFKTSEIDDSDVVKSGRLLIFNFYSMAISTATEVSINDQEQIDRIGSMVYKYPEGAVRSAAIRRLCRFFAAEILEDIMDDKKKTLQVDLMPPKKDFMTEYQMISSHQPGEVIRPVGIPGPFFPLDTCGYLLHREGMTLKNRDKSMPSKDFLVSLYTKSTIESPERGLVLKLYDRTTSYTSVLHIGASELIRLCQRADEPDLLRDISYAKDIEESLLLDEVESGLIDFTEKGDMQKNIKQLIHLLMSIVISDLGFILNPQDQVVPIILSAPRGLPPI